MGGDSNDHSPSPYRMQIGDSLYNVKEDSHSLLFREFLFSYHIMLQVNQIVISTTEHEIRSGEIIPL